MIQNNQARAAQEEQILPEAPLASADFDRDVHCILGLPFDRVSVEQAADQLRVAARDGRRCFFSTPNLNFAIACMDDPAFRNSVIQSDLSIADGMPLIWIAKVLGIPLHERVAGSSLFQALRLADARRPVARLERPLKVYFFGGPPGVAEAASIRLNAEQSRMRCVGFNSPGFGSVAQMSDAKSIEHINRSGADFLVVALGAKKGQEWIKYNLPALQVPLVSHLGAVINFVAGTVSRAPGWLQKCGLEWVWRIKEEPKLWRRYWDDGAALLQLLATRVVPAMLARRKRPAKPEFDRAALAVRDEGDRIVLALSGAWGGENIDRLRPALKQLAASPAILVCIDLDGTDFVDSAVLALLMLLQGDCVAKARSLQLANSSPALRRLLRWHCADYLIEPAGHAA